MFAPFVHDLRRHGLPVSVTEWLALMRALREGVADHSADDFHFLARTILVKDERYLDRFDRAFAEFFRGLEREEAPTEGDDARRELPEEWLRKLAENLLTEEERAAVEALGGFDKLMETLRQRLADQESRHQGGSRMIGTAGTSPFGAHCYNPEGVRIGQDGSRHRRAVKVWDRREFRDLDGDEALGPRAMKLALRRLRRFARAGEATELDLDGTIGATARNAGSLDLRMRPERHNAVKVLLLLDIGGSMDDHIRASEALFAAARSEFKHLVHLYFHNCPYERLWTSNTRRQDHLRPTEEVLRTYGPDWKLVVVGDASMSPHEILEAGGSVEHFNAEPGRVWLRRILGHFRRSAWLNPLPERHWAFTRSVGIVQREMEGRMFPLGLEGLDGMARALR